MDEPTVTPAIVEIRLHARSPRAQGASRDACRVLVGQVLVRRRLRRASTCNAANSDHTRAQLDTIPRAARHSITARILAAKSSRQECQTARLSTDITRCNRTCNVRILPYQDRDTTSPGYMNVSSHRTVLLIGGLVRAVWVGGGAEEGARSTAKTTSAVYVLFGWNATVESIDDSRLRPIECQVGFEVRRRRRPRSNDGRYRTKVSTATRNLSLRHVTSVSSIGAYYIWQSVLLSTRPWSDDDDDDDDNGGDLRNTFFKICNDLVSVWWFHNHPDSAVSHVARQRLMGYIHRRRAFFRFVNDTPLDIGCWTRSERIE